MTRGRSGDAVPAAVEPRDRVVLPAIARAVHAPDADRILGIAAFEVFERQLLPERAERPRGEQSHARALRKFRHRRRAVDEHLRVLEQRRLHRVAVRRHVVDDRRAAEGRAHQQHRPPVELLLHEGVQVRALRVDAHRAARPSA